MRNTTKYLILLFSFFLIQVSYGQTLLNGGFAGPETYSSAAPSWTSSGGSPDLVTIPSILIPALTYIAPGAAVSSQGGNFQLLYESLGQTGTEKLSQTVTGFTIGTTYTITYEEANFGTCYQANCYTVNGEFLVNVSGIPQMSSGNDLVIADTWYTVCLTFVATSTTHTIEFEANCLNTNGGISGAWMALDNIQISTGGGGGGNATFSYANDSLCISSPATTPNNIVTPGGTFSSSPAGLIIDQTTGNIDPSLSTPGIYNITYTLGGCAGGTFSVPMTIVGSVSAGADNNTAICNTAGSTVDLNTILVGASPGGSWTELTASGSFDPLTGIFDASGLAAGTYNFTYDLAGAGTCPGDQALIDVVIDQQVIAGADNNTSICNSTGSTIDLNTLLIGSTAGGVWSEITASGSFDPLTGIFDASGLAVGTYNFAYDLPAVGACPADQALIDVVVNAGPDAGADNNTSICNIAGSTIDLNTIVLGLPGGVWVELTASGSFDPLTGILDASGLAPGTYNFTYNLLPAGVCPGDEALIDVIVGGTTNAGADNTAQSCNSAGTSIDLNTLLIGADLGGAFTEITASGAFNPVTGILNSAGLAAGVYVFNYTTSNASGCPPDVAEFTVTVEPSPTMLNLLDESVCDGDDLTPQVFTSDIAGSTFDWTVTVGGDVGFGTSGIGDIGTFTGINGTNVNVVSTVEVTPTSPFGCVGTPSSFDVTIYPLPQVSFDADVTSGCDPLEVNFTNTTAQSSNCTWDFGDFQTGSGCGVVTHIYTTPGQFSVDLTVTSAEGCVNNVTYSDYINVVSTPIAQFNFTPNTEISSDNPEVMFNNTSQYADSYVWDFGDNSAASTETNPTHMYPNSGGSTYTVMLVVTNQGACSDTAYHFITVEDNIIFYVPNSFTPNGDEFNNGFQPVFTSGFDPFDYHFTIFSRWGEIVFESYNAGESWDGTYHNSEVVQDGTYVWVVRFKETMSDKKHEHQGHVNVLR